jgi:biotin transport system substrate-specific component
MRPAIASIATGRSQRVNALNAGGLVLLGSLVMTGSSWVEVPMIPVPMNMQSLAAPLLGIVMGSRLGTLAVVAWLVEACLGLPVLSGGAAGGHHLLGPTGGYLFAFPLAAFFCGLLWERLSHGTFVRSFGIMLLGNATILLLGVVWLATMIGWQPALESGLYPFLLGALMKSLLAAGMVTLVCRQTTR